MWCIVFVGAIVNRVSGVVSVLDHVSSCATIGVGHLITLSLMLDDVVETDVDTDGVSKGPTSVADDDSCNEDIIDDDEDVYINIVLTVLGKYI